MIVTLPDMVCRQLANAAEAEKPREACGLLLGISDGAGISVQACIFTDNVTDSDPEIVFEIDPAVHLQLQKDARSGGKQIIGVWHSHPTAPPIPSVEDQQRSLEKGWLWLITGRVENGWETAAFLAGKNNSHTFEKQQFSIV